MFNTKLREQLSKDETYIAIKDKYDEQLMKDSLYKELRDNYVLLICHYNDLVDIRNGGNAEFFNNLDDKIKTILYQEYNKVNYQTEVLENQLKQQEERIYKELIFKEFINK